MKKWTFVMLLIVFLLFGSVIGFNLFKQQKIAEYMANMPEPDYPVTSQKLTATKWTPTIDAIGFVDPNQGVTLTSQLSGEIKKINFESGQKVTKGQVLVQLDTNVEAANLKSTQAKLPASKAKYIRYQNLYKKGAISQEEYDEASADYFSMISDIDSLKATIERRQVIAPFSGVVGIRNVYLGQFLTSGTDVVRLEDTSIMRLRFTIPQTDITKIKIGQSIDIHIDSYPNTKFEGSISAIEPAVNAQSGLIQVQADIPNNQGKLRTGMFARASIILPTLEDQITIPQTAINYTLYGDSVYVIEKKDGVSRVQQKVIKVGERTKSIAHIIKGLKPGDEIVTTGQVRLSNGVKVHQVKSDATTPPETTPML